MNKKINIYQIIKEIKNQAKRLKKLRSKQKIKNGFKKYYIKF